MKIKLISTEKSLSSLIMPLFAVLAASVMISCERMVWTGIEEDPLPDLEILEGFPIIDMHQNLYGASGLVGSNYDHIPFETYVTPQQHYEALVQRMMDNNVVLGVAEAPLSTIENYYDEYPENRSMFYYSAHFYQISEGGLATVLAKLRKTVQAGKIRSIGELGGIYSGVPFDNPSYMQLYALADTFGLPVCLHTGIVPKQTYENSPSYLFEESNPAELKEILETFPGVNFCAAHFGISNHNDYDFRDDVLEMMHTYDNFFVDISATLWISKHGQKKTIELIKRAIDEGVEDKILFGSDNMQWPDAITAGINCIKQADYMTDSVKKQILYWNAATYLKLSDEEIKGHFVK